jgi:hypothetical protein
MNCRATPVFGVFKHGSPYVRCQDLVSFPSNRHHLKVHRVVCLCCECACVCVCVFCFVFVFLVCILVSLIYITQL